MSEIRPGANSHENELTDSDERKIGVISERETIH